MANFIQGWPDNLLWVLVCLCLCHLTTATEKSRINDTNSNPNSIDLISLITTNSSKFNSQSQPNSIETLSNLNLNLTKEKHESPALSSNIKSLLTDNVISEEIQTNTSDIEANTPSTSSIVSILELTSAFSTTATQTVQLTKNHTLSSFSVFEKQSPSLISQDTYSNSHVDTSLENNESNPVIIPTFSINESRIIAELGINTTFINDTTTNDTSSQDDDRPNFLTFEEWKKIKIDDEGGELAQHRKASQQKKRPEMHPRMANNLNGPVGEEMEIEIEMFGGGGDDDITEKGKVYKGGFNYASFDCAANIVKTNSEVKGASAILSENKDTYLLNECLASNKHIIIELCEDILVDEVLIGNYEFFSSMFKNIRLSISDRFPINSWTVLGEFKAENIRNLQTFEIKNPLIWAKYLKIEVLSYYGDEFYCPLSSVQVHGKTMLEQFKEENPEDLIVEEVEVIRDDKTKEIQGNERLSEIKTDEYEQLEFPNPPDFDTFLKETIQLIETDIDSTRSPNEDCLVSPYLGLNQFLEDYKKNIDNDLCSPSTDTKLVEPKPKTTSATTQDSIYKNIIKRISLLESNATLSLLYIEEQSKLLSTAFNNLETRENNKFNSLLLHLNTTIQAQIDRLKVSGDELTGSFETVFDIQNQKFQDLLIHSNLKLDRFENSLEFQKKINYLTLLIVFLLLLYIIVTRDTYIEPEFMNPIYQNSQFNLDTSSPTSPSMPSSPEQQAYKENNSYYLFERGINKSNSSLPKTSPVTFKRKSRLLRSFLRSASGGSISSFPYVRKSSVATNGEEVGNVSTGSLPIIVDDFETRSRSESGSGLVTDEYEYEVEKSVLDQSDTTSKLSLESENMETPSEDGDENRHQEQHSKPNNENGNYITSITIDETPTTKK